MKLVAIFALLVAVISAHALNEDADVLSRLREQAQGPGALIAIRGDTGLYLSRINRGSIDPIEVAKSDFSDSPSQFCLRQDGDTFTIQADNGKFLGRIFRNGINAIEAAKDEVDQFSKFKLEQQPMMKVAIRADTGRYLSRINRGDKDPIEASKSSADFFSRFEIVNIPGGCGE